MPVQLQRVPELSWVYLNGFWGAELSAEEMDRCGCYSKTLFMSIHSGPKGEVYLSSGVDTIFQSAEGLGCFQDLEVAKKEGLIIWEYWYHSFWEKGFYQASNRVYQSFGEGSLYLVGLIRRDGRWERVRPRSPDYSVLRDLPLPMQMHPLSPVEVAIKLF